MRAGALICVVALSGPACTAAPRPSLPVQAPPPAATVSVEVPLEAPPPSIASEPNPFPAIDELALENGLSVSIVRREHYPVVEVRLILLGGSASDGPQPGRAELASELLEAGGAGKLDPYQLATRIENLGSSLRIDALPDSTQISLAVTSGNLDAALDVLSDVVLRPRFDADELEKLRQRKIGDARTALVSDPSYEANLALFRQLYRGHPYAHFGALPSELDALTLKDCRDWYRSQVTPKNAVLVLVGDLEPQRALARVKRLFGGWRGPRPSLPPDPVTRLSSHRTVWVVDRPGLAQSEIRVAGLATKRQSPDWPAIAADNQLLGGETAGRLFLEVRERLSLAYHTGSVLIERRQGRVPLVLSAATRTDKTADALRALLQQAAALSSSPAAVSETEMATRYLVDGLSFQIETVSGLAGLVARLKALDLPDGYYDDYQKQLLAMGSAELFATTLRTIDFWSPIMVVVGDASRLEQSLRAFGSVTVLNPREELAKARELPPL